MSADGMPTTKKALVASFFDRVWCQKNLDYHHEILGPDFRLTALWQNTSLGGSGQADREVSLGLISRWIQGFPDLRISIEEQVGDGDYVASRHRFWGTHANDFMGYAATGISVVISGNTVMKFSRDKIVGAWSCWDAASFLTQIGALPRGAGCAPPHCANTSGAVVGVPRPSRSVRGDWVRWRLGSTRSRARYETGCWAWFCQRPGSAAMKGTWRSPRYRWDEGDTMQDRLERETSLIRVRDDRRIAAS